MDKLKPLAEELDIISIHSYPIWEYQTIGAAIHYTAQNYHAVKQHYPDKPVIITEAGWTTRSDGYNIDVNNASTQLQSTYCKQLMEWSQNNKILTFVFEAFDEPWKGSEHKDEPEKHWGLYYVDRKPKPVVEEF